MDLRNVPTNEPADHGVQKDDKGGTESVEEEEELSLFRVFLGQLVEDEADEVEHGECSEAHCSIEIGSPQVLQSVDENLVSLCTCGEASDAHHGGDLANSNIDGGAADEGGDRGERNKVNDPSETSETDESHDCSADD